MTNQISNGVKKILIFSTAYWPKIGGAEVAVKEITERIKEFSARGGPASGWEFDLITARMDKNLIKFEAIGKVKVYRVGFGWGTVDKFILPFGGLLLAIKLNRASSYDLIWSIMASQASIAAAWFKIFYPAKKLLLTLQEGDEEEHLARYVGGNKFLYQLLIKPWHLLVFKKADYITTISSHLKKRALASGAKCEIEVVPNGVDVEKFSAKGGQNSPPKADPPLAEKLEIEELKNKLGIKEDKKVVISVSRLVKKNGLEDLISAMVELPPTKLIIIGSGELENVLKLKIKDLKLAEQVLMLGQIKHQQIPEYLAIADIFVRPSLSEGLGNVFLEAMAVGLPVIGTPVGGIVDFLVDGQTGLFCQIGNPASIAQKIKQILADEQLRQRLIENGKKLVREKYNWDSIAQKMQATFLKILVSP